MERRIGQRSDHDGISIRWWPPRGPGSTRRLFGPRRGQAAALVDVSVTGLLVEAPANDHLKVGDTVTVTVDDVTGPVTIRRVVGERGDPTWRYGVELLDLTSELTTHIHAKLSERAHVSATQWHRPPRR